MAKRDKDGKKRHRRKGHKGSKGSGGGTIQLKPGTPKCPCGRTIKNPASQPGKCKNCGAKLVWGY